MQHKGLENGRWAEMSFINQMANIGSEVGRASKWKKKGNREMATNAFERALELIDLTIKFGRTDSTITEGSRKSMLKEICRLRECFCEEFLSEDLNAIEPTEKYFMHFALAQRIKSVKS